LKVETLTGPVAPQDLGIVAMREHLLLGRHGWHWAPEVRFDRAAAFESVLARLEAFKKRGGGTLVDASGITLGRNVPFYRRLSELSGVHIVASTGFGEQSSSIPGHFLGRAYRVSTDARQHWVREIPGHFYSSHGESKEYLMFLFYNELTEGMAAPCMIRTGIKAGIVQTGSAWDGVSRLEEFSIRAAAMAARHAGVSVITTSAGQARRHFELLSAEGLEAQRIVIGHCDDARAVDLGRDRSFAEKGAYVAYDHIGWEKDAPHAMADDERVALVKAMVQAGYAERVVLSSSAVGAAMGLPASIHGYERLLADFVPRLDRAGIGEAVLETLLVDTPRRLLAASQDEEAAEQLRAFAEGFRSASRQQRWDV